MGSSDISVIKQLLKKNVYIFGILIFVIGLLLILNPFWFTGLNETTVKIMSDFGVFLTISMSIPFIYNYILKDAERHILISEIKSTLNDCLRNEETKKIIYYVPTLLENQFYHEVLDSLILSAQDKYEIIVKKPSSGTIDRYHENYLGYIKGIEDLKSNSSTVLALIPPNPSFHSKLIEISKKTKIKIITLDMSVPDENKEEFIKTDELIANISLDNMNACSDIAKNIYNYCNKQFIKKINIIICEGNFHSRGAYFKEALTSICCGHIELKFFPQDEDCLMPLNFSSAVSEAYSRVYDILMRQNYTVLNDMANNLTLIFCANDNMGIGARNSLIKIETETEHLTEDRRVVLDKIINNVKIICYDYSFNIRNLIKNKDKFVYFSLQQDYSDFGEKIVETCDKLFSDKKISNKFININYNFKDQK